MRVQHIPNSGWPGKPRNLGIDMARGEYVFFVDNDDWLERDALERLHAMAVAGSSRHRDRQGRRPRQDRTRGGSSSPTCTRSASTPTSCSACSRRTSCSAAASLDEHGLRFPEGKRRLEDHPFVVVGLLRGGADLRARGPPRSTTGRAASGRRPRPRDASTPAGYFDNVREVLDLVEARHAAGARARRAAAALVPRQDAQARRRTQLAVARGGLPARAVRGGPPARARALRRGASTSGCRSTCGCARSCCGAATSTRSGRLVALRAPDHARGAHPRDRARRHAPRAAAGVVVRRAGPALRFERDGKRTFWVPPTDDARRGGARRRTAR